MATLKELRQVRLDKHNKLLEMGINPYPPSAQKDISNAEIVESYQKHADKEYSIVGRIMSIREHGKLVFAQIQDNSGQIQLYIRSEILAPTNIENQTLGFDALNLFDVGDFVEARGIVTKTQKGEISLQPTTLKMLSKAIRPLPDKYHGLKDEEERNRKRYLDLIMSPESKRILDTRWKITSQTRRFLEGNAFVEVETPILQNLYGGTNAKPFTTHFNALDSEFYLRVAPELYLKRLIVSGYERVFEVAKNFRNEGIDQTHFPEFTMLEWYMAYADYHAIMDLAEGLIKHLAKEVLGSSKIKVNDVEVDVYKEWPRVPFKDLLKEHLDIDADALNEAEVRALLKEHKVAYRGSWDKDKALFAIFDHVITKKLIDPIWVIDYPISVSPLAKAHRSKKRLAERFEGYIGGMEVFDGWSEISSGVEQRSRFENEQKNMQDGDDEAMPLDEDFIEALEHGCPPLGGIGFGMDRLTMFLTNTWSIKKVVAFPILKARSRPTLPSNAQAEPVDFSIDENNIVSNEVEEKFPGIFFASVEISNVSVKKSSVNLEKKKEALIKKMSKLSKADLLKSGPVLAYSELFKTLGLDPKSKQPSPLALRSRIAKGKGLYNVNNAVDAYNLAVIETGIGLGGFDASNLNSPVSLRYSVEGEKMTLLGESEETILSKKALVYADASGPITLHLNYRDIDRTKLTEDTKKIVLFADGAPNISQEAVLAGLKKGAEYIQMFCGGEIGEYKLTRANSLSEQTSTETAASASAVEIPSADITGLPSKEQAHELLEKHVGDDYQKLHSKMVARVLEEYAIKLGKDSDLWYITGLLHDLDYFEHPAQHPDVSLGWFRDWGYPENLMHAIKCHKHAFEEETKCEPQTKLAAALIACDELAGLIYAYSLMRPNGWDGMKAKSIKKKFKDKAFAAKINREEIMYGVEKFEVDPTEHIEFLINVFQGMEEFK